jgi:predicted ATPase
VAHPFVLTYYHFYANLLYQFEFEPLSVQREAEAIIALARQHDFTYFLGMGMILRGWAQIQLGQHPAGIGEMQQGMATLDDTGTVLFRHYYLSFLADAYRQAGEIAQGLESIRQALAAVPSSGRFWEAELYRLQGELLLLDPAAGACAAAEASFHQAIAIAQGQRAKALELRATISLSRLWQREGKTGDAHRRLAELYGWFSEGFDSAHLQEAKRLYMQLQAYEQEKLHRRLRRCSFSLLSWIYSALRAEIPPIFTLHTDGVVPAPPSPGMSTHNCQES